MLRPEEETAPSRSLGFVEVFYDDIDRVMDVLRQDVGLGSDAAEQANPVVDLKVGKAGIGDSTADLERARRRDVAGLVIRRRTRPHVSVHLEWWQARVQVSGNGPEARKLLQETTQALAHCRRPIRALWPFVVVPPVAFASALGAGLLTRVFDLPAVIDLALWALVLALTAVSTGALASLLVMRSRAVVRRMTHAEGQRMYRGRRNVAALAGIPAVGAVIAGALIFLDE